jgi:hypothetical protein
VTRARLLRYAPYQLKDYVLERGLVTLLIVALTLGPPLGIVRHQRGPGWGTGGDGAALLARLLVDVAVPVASLTVLFAIHGISSLDRQRGYFRFLFSKPVSVAAYYAQEFVVRLVGVLTVAALSAGTVAMLGGGAFPGQLVAYVALTYALLGGVGFLLSALVQFDGLLLILVWLVAHTAIQVRRLYPHWIPEPVVRALPPVDKLDAARDAWLAGTGTFPAGDLLWAVGYGLACFVLGLVALRRRPLAR